MVRRSRSSPGNPTAQRQRIKTRWRSLCAGNVEQLLLPGDELGHGGGIFPPLLTEREFARVGAEMARDRGAIAFSFPVARSPQHPTVDNVAVFFEVYRFHEYCIPSSPACQGDGVYLEETACPSPVWEAVASDSSTHCGFDAIFFLKGFPLVLEEVLRCFERSLARTGEVQPRTKSQVLDYMGEATFPHIR